MDRTISLFWGVRKPTGKDEFGKVPYICEVCKKEEATILTSKGKFCEECHKNLKNLNLSLFV